MKFHVAAELQRRWVTNPPKGWHAAKETDLLARAERRILGYRPVVDVVLTNLESRRRLWIELEISRADPVANHTKFASAHLIHPIGHEDAFVSLVSNHVTRGRANLAAHMVYFMRSGGIRAFQMPLLGELAGARISGINQGLVPLSELPTPDLGEVIQLTNPVMGDADTEIYFATNTLEVLLNVRQWNLDVLHEEGRSAWGHRRIKYLVFDKRTGLFAPSKFCAYTRIRKQSVTLLAPAFNPAMTVIAYSKVPQDCGIFDGHRAWKRLSGIGFSKVKATAADAAVRDRLAGWIKANSALVTIDPGECEILIEG